MEEIKNNNEIKFKMLLNEIEQVLFHILISKEDQKMKIKLFSFDYNTDVDFYNNEDNYIHFSIYINDIIHNFKYKIYKDKITEEILNLYFRSLNDSLLNQCQQYLKNNIDKTIYQNIKNNNKNPKSFLFINNLSLNDDFSGIEYSFEIDKKELMKLKIEEF